ncbi:MAG: type II toxin-antitoxin system RelE/ParE family toxin [Methanocorpusculum sp.]|nr:type II toxin-antitoxin system RelE/ParE family toxin [Methanocorpusculum sp.]
MTFTVFVLDKADEALNRLSDEEYDRCVAELNTLALNPYPGFGGDKEKLKGYENRYRIHIGRSYTAIYEINKDKKRVCVSFFGRIGKAHKKY